MANRYVRSTDGNDADDGSTWALADASVAGSAAGDAAGDVIYVSDNHAESNAAAQTWAFAGTVASPTKVICVDDSAEPPTATATTATCTTTGTNGFVITGNCYVYGITFNVGTGASTLQFSAHTGTDIAEYEQCSFKLVGTSTNATIALGQSANSQGPRITWRDCSMSFAAAGQRIFINQGVFTWFGGSVLSGSSAATSGLLCPGGSGDYNVVLVSGVDLTNVGVTGFLVGKNTGTHCRPVLVNCKIPAFTTGGLVTGTLQIGDRVSLYNCDSSDPTSAGSRLWIKDYFGEITSDTAVYNDAGANDGVVRLSWKMVSTADTEFPHQVLVSDEIVKWNETTGSSQTATVEIVHNSQGSGTSGALLDSEIWLEVMYYSASGTPIGSWASDRCGNLNLNSNAADQASSSAAWTGDSAGWDTQKLSVSFTAQEKGYVHARVCLAKASATVYVDPLITIA